MSEDGMDMDDSIGLLIRRTLSMAGPGQGRAFALVLSKFDKVVDHEGIEIPNDDKAQEKSSSETAKKTRSKQNPYEDPDLAFGTGLQDEPEKTRIAAPNDAVQVPTVLAIVELLQFLRHERGLSPGERPKSGTLRIALLASAWDSADMAWQRKGPAAFFAENAPLLREFLWSNHRPEDVMCFGLSSTAGDLNDPEYQKVYRRQRAGYVQWADASGRIHQTSNITLPIEWALFGDEAFTRVMDDETVHS